MRSLYAGLGFVLLLSLPAAASAQRAFTVTRASTTDTTRPVFDADEPILRYRRTSTQQELVFRRAARAAAQREARIQWRRRTGNSASRPNIVFDRPPAEWYGSWRMRYATVSYSRAR